MTYWFVFCKDSLLLKKDGNGSYSIPFQEEPPVTPKPWTAIHDITPMGNGTAVKAFSTDYPVSDQEDMEMCGLRASYYKLSTELYLKAGQCHEILYWDYNTKFCGVCGAPMQLHTAISKRCTNCGKEVWPQLAIAVIVLISRGDEVLLVRGKNFRSDFYGLVAGFVETGETLEEALCREVKEETGIRIRNIRYYGSQPWPYPCGLMVGFFADYKDGECHLQRSELTDGQWFHVDRIPRIPEKLSIARKMIDQWIENKKKGDVQS